MTLLADILAYCARTGSSETAIGTAVTRDGRYVAFMRDGREPRPDTERAFRRYMAEHPNGVVRGGAGRQSMARFGLGYAANPPLPDRPIVDREPCFFCGVRGDIGCGCRKY